MCCIVLEVMCMRIQESNFDRICTVKRLCTIVATNDTCKEIKFGRLFFGSFIVAESILAPKKISHGTMSAT